MRILFLTGIWPPDVGGPATHGPDFARFLVAHGHGVRVVTMGDGEPTDRPCPVDVVSRRLPFPARYGLVAAKAARAGSHADVVYATATYLAAAAAVTAARRPLVVKLVSDPAYERARRYGLVRGTVDDFQAEGGGRVDALKRLRTASLRRAATVVVPSAYLGAIAAGWGLDAERIVVLPNPAPAVDGVEPASLGAATFVFAGRLTAQKSLATAIDALARVPAARLVLVGDGPEREAVERRAREAGVEDRVELVGARPRPEVLGLLAGAEALVLPSAWENLPHAALEALAVGTPVVASAVGGVPEVVRDGENGLLVEPGSAEQLADAMRRVLEEHGLRERLAGAAAASVAPFGREYVYGSLERILREAAA